MCRFGSAGPPVPGYDIQIKSRSDADVNTDDVGDIVAKLPLPPGTLSGLWNNDAGICSRSSLC